LTLLLCSMLIYGPYAILFIVHWHGLYSNLQIICSFTPPFQIVRRFSFFRHSFCYVLRYTLCLNTWYKSNVSRITKTSYNLERREYIFSVSSLVSSFNLSHDTVCTSSHSHHKSVNEPGLNLHLTDLNCPYTLNYFLFSSTSGISYIYLFLFNRWDCNVWCSNCGIQVHPRPPVLFYWRRWGDRAYSSISSSGILWCCRTTSQVTSPLLKFIFSTAVCSVTCYCVSADCIWMCFQSWWFQKHGWQKDSTWEFGPDPVVSWWNCWWRVKPCLTTYTSFLVPPNCVHLLSFLCHEISWLPSAACLIFVVWPWQ